jgi:fructosamine-3-kinase
MGRHYGFQSDNFLGLTPLKNDWADDLATFFIQNRLLPQLVAVSLLCVYFQIAM